MKELARPIHPVEGRVVLFQFEIDNHQATPGARLLDHRVPFGQCEPVIAPCHLNDLGLSAGVPRRNPIPTAYVFTHPFIKGRR